MLGEAYTKLAIIGAIALLGAFSLLYYFFQRGAFRRSLNSDLNDLRAFVEDSKQRFETLSPHALDYFNSMSGEIAKSFGRLKTIIQALDERVNVIDQLISSKRDSSLYEAETLIFSDLTFCADSMHSVLGEESMDDLPRSRWEVVVENLFQEVGAEIAHASSASAGLPKPKPRDRKNTSDSLHLAGIATDYEEETKLDDDSSDDLAEDEVTKES